MRKEIVDVLEKFQEGYVERDVKSIDCFMDELFDRNSQITIIGTGTAEWCIGFEEAKELFTSDWQYWGDLRINIEDASITSSVNTAWVSTAGTLGYSFVRNNETFARYLGYVKEFFADGSEHKNSSNKVKLTEINWVLSHLLHQRDKSEVKYLWNIGVSFVLTRSDNRWVIRQMMFSMPVVSHFPDVRIAGDNWCAGAYKEEYDKIKSCSEKDTSMVGKDIRGLLDNFKKDYFKKDLALESIGVKYFSSSNPFVVNTDMQDLEGIEGIEKLTGCHRSSWDEFILNSEEAIVDYNGCIAWVAANGIAKKTINEEYSFDMAADVVKGIFDSDASDKEKLFRIRRAIAGTLKENSVGEEYAWPFRFEAVLTNNSGNWLFEYVQFSYPFSYILEGKTDAAIVVE